MNHQDFKDIVIHSKNSRLKQTKKEIVKKNVTNSNKIQVINSKKLENEDVRPEYVSKEDVKKIIQARTLLKLSQQDLANKLNVKKNVINELESGKMLKNGLFISKIKKVLKLI